MSEQQTQHLSSPQGTSYRYPGVTPFSTEQQHIFFGRKQDTDELYRLLRREPLVVLYGKSGLGKSSLLNAGIIPACQKKGEYSPFVVRFGAWTEDAKVTPLAATKTALSEGFEPGTFLDSLLPGDASLWYHAKTRQLLEIEKLEIEKLENSGAGQPPIYLRESSISQFPNFPISPLLLFDQFEELFSYPEAQVQAFREELSELLNTGIPLRFRRMAEASKTLSEEEEDRLEMPLDARIVFAIRSDRMHLLDRLKDHLPNVLRHTFELKALARDDAKDAIVLPAQMISDVGFFVTLEGSDLGEPPTSGIPNPKSFTTPPFGYSPAALAALLDFLEDEQDKEKRVEGILLQMLCEHYERRLVEAQGFTLLDLPQIGDPNDVVQHYYEEKIAALPEDSRLPARRLIEDGLVSEGEAMRLTLHESYIRQEFGVDKTLLEQLVDIRLLRSEPFLRGGYTYELSHDRLVPPVLNARSLRREEEARLEAERQARELEATRKRLRMVRGLLAAAVVALLAAGYFGYDANQKKKAANEAKTIAQNNLQKAEKLINAFYFYEDRFALAHNETGEDDFEVYYFIDKNGDEVTNLGKWEEAELFKFPGFAKVTKMVNYELMNYLLDTMGNTYRVTYDIRKLDAEITALDLFGNELTGIPSLDFSQNAQSLCQ
ncbi:MAG: ATP-binding protein [Saprospiraceae bacterium]|nr:MAG: ATP-binding protein [Saprospiraceae bacterium]